jgi:HTH-type transcriptional regulator/antitoxin HigA
MRTKEGVPVIGLTIRYDRLDNFWFCLLHEAAHVSQHLGDEELSLLMILNWNARIMPKTGPLKLKRTRSHRKR